MRIIKLYKRVAGEELMAIVPFDRAHVQQLQQEGYYRKRIKQFNKHGILVVSA